MPVLVGVGCSVDLGGVPWWWDRTKGSPSGLTRDMAPAPETVGAGSSVERAALPLCWPRRNSLAVGSNSRILLLVVMVGAGSSVDLGLLPVCCPTMKGSASGLTTYSPPPVVTGGTGSSVPLGTLLFRFAPTKGSPSFCGRCPAPRAAAAGAGSSSAWVPSETFSPRRFRVKSSPDSPFCPWGASFPGLFPVSFRPGSALSGSSCRSSSLMYRGARGPPNLSRPRAMRCLVLTLSGFFRYLGSSMRDRPRSSQLMISRAPRHGRRPGNMPVSPLAWVGSGQRTGFPSLRAIRKNRTLVVASP